MHHSKRYFPVSVELSEQGCSWVREAPFKMVVLWVWVIYAIYSIRPIEMYCIGLLLGYTMIGTICYCVMVCVSAFMAVNSSINQPPDISGRDDRFFAYSWRTYKVGRTFCRSCSFVYHGMELLVCRTAFLRTNLSHWALNWLDPFMLGILGP